MEHVNASSSHLDKIYEESKQLDPECLRLMDLKLKKMQLNNIASTAAAATTMVDERNKQRRIRGSDNLFSWEIPVKREQQQQPPYYETTALLSSHRHRHSGNNQQAIMSNSYPPRFLSSSRSRRETTTPLSGEISNRSGRVGAASGDDLLSASPVKTNELWMRTQLKTLTSSNIEEYFSQQLDYDPETNLQPHTTSSIEQRHKQENENNATDCPNTSKISSKMLLQQPNEPAAASKDNSKMKQQKLLLKHENRIRSLEKLIELEKMRAQKLQQRIISDGSSSPLSSHDVVVEHDEYVTTETEDDNDGHQMCRCCRCYCCCCCHSGGDAADVAATVDDDNGVEQQIDESNYHRRHMMPLDTSVGLNSAPIERDDVAAAAAAATTATASNDMLTRSRSNERASSNERKIPIVVEKRPPESWFFSVDNPKFNIKESKKSVENETAAAKIYPHPYQPADQKFWEYDRYAPMTLQEAFRAHRYDAILSSRRRVRELKAKEARRQLAKELLLSIGSDGASSGISGDSARLVAGGGCGDETELYRAMAERLEFDRRRHVAERHRVIWNQSNGRFAYFNELSTRPTRRPHCAGGVAHGAAAVMSKREAKERTRRKYEKLPEVQQRLLREKLEENKVKNRIKSNLYKKTIQQRVLANGPNFDLNFKALGYSIQ